MNFNNINLELNPGEHIASVMRKHWFILLIEILPFLILFIMPIILLILIPINIFSTTTLAYTAFFISFFMLVILMTIFTIWTLYYLDIWIVTNQRIIDIEQKSLFKRESKTLRMSTVQDVQVDEDGFIETIFNFGTLRVQTAGTGGTDAKIIGIPKPNLERDIIIQQTNAIHHP